MYLQLGQGEVLPFEDVVGVFDLDHVTSQKRTRDTLAAMEARGELHTLGGRLPVSLVVGQTGAWLSPFSSVLLCRRLADERWE